MAVEKNETGKALQMALAKNNKILQAIFIKITFNCLDRPCKVISY